MDFTHIKPQNRRLLFFHLSQDGHPAFCRFHNVFLAQTNTGQVLPGTASKVTDIGNLKWTDKTWMEKRETWRHTESPMSIYEAHIGS